MGFATGAWTAKFAAVSDPTDDPDATVEMRIGVVVGRRFADRYEVEALLGRGGMGSVYRVRDRAVDEIVALKLLDGSVATPEAIERFRREVRLARRVTHRNAARTYDLGEWQGHHYLTMENVDGQSLREFVPRKLPSRPPAAENSPSRPPAAENSPSRPPAAENSPMAPLTPRRVVDIAMQIAHGLAAAHQAGVVHRDLKPANVLVEPAGRVVITDFGIARGTQSSDATLHTGGLLGTPAYMAPEQLAGELVDGRADLYALGLIVFELLTGKLPGEGEGESAIAMALARLHRPLPDFAAESAIPALLIPVLEQLLARELGERPANAEALIDMLAQIGQEWGPELGTLGMPRAPATLSAPPPTTTTSTATRRGRTLAVLPFRYRGPEAERPVAEALSDELIDVLSSIKGLQVTGSGATARFASEGDRDPKTIGSELGVDAIVDGTVQLSGQRLRISARLLDVENGFQLWSERYDGALEDVFELQDRLGKRIAEALRLELEHIAHRGDASAEAIEVYLHARGQARQWEFVGDEGAVVLYERCLAIAPEFKPAMAGLAIACMRAWFNPQADARDWASLAADAVARARVDAAELAETHLAIASLAVQLGNYAEAASALAQALRIAPTYAAAHDYLGRLQLEAGQPDQGIRHVELAMALDPMLNWSRPDIARYHALRGDRPAYAAAMAEYVAAIGRDDYFPAVVQEIRVASWFGDLDEVRACYARLSPGSSDALAILPHVQLLLADTVDTEQVNRALSHAASLPKNPRFNALVLQLSAESLAFRGFDDLAMRCLIKAAEGVLVDHDWLERCPLLAPLRVRSEYPAVRELVLARARAIWGL